MRAFSLEITLLFIILSLSLVCGEECFRPQRPDGSIGSLICLPDEYIRESVGDAGLKNPVFYSIDSSWVLVCGILVFFMQAGFIMLEAGSVSRKNIVNIVFKNFMDVCVGAMAWYLVGYGFAFGSKNREDNPFIGEGNFALVDELDEENSDYHLWWFQFAFAATASTIVSGSVAERAKLSIYFIYSGLMLTVVYPIVVHWVWDDDGWLRKLGYIDFAGASVVHTVGGMTGLVGAKLLGPRLGRFKPDISRKSFRPHSIIPQALGVSMLWFGWYGFNAGSTLGLTRGADRVASRTIVTTTLSSASAGIVAVFIGKFTNIGMRKERTWDLVLMLNGVLAGLVAITGASATIYPPYAIVIGAISSFVYVAFSKLLIKFKIDDPLDAAPVHMGCGIWGIIATGVFSDPALIALIRDQELDRITQFGVQLLGITAIAAWTFITSFIMFYGMEKTMGLRVPKVIEQEGLDMHEHLINAYDVEDFAAGGQSFRVERIAVNGAANTNTDMRKRPTSSTNPSGTYRGALHPSYDDPSNTGQHSSTAELELTEYQTSPDSRANGHTKLTRQNSFSMASAMESGSSRGSL